MNRKKLSPKSIIFYKLYLVNILITIIFICMISVICIAFSSRLILNNLIAFNEEMIAEKSNSLNERVKQLEEAVNLMIGEENVFRLLMTDEPYYEKPTMLLKIIRHFQNICSNNSLIEGISLIDMKRGIVITEKTKVPLKDWEDLKQYHKQNSFAINETEEGKKLEFVRSFEPVRGEKDVFVVLTVNEAVFTSNLLIGNETEMVKSYLLTDDGKALSVNGMDEMDPDIMNCLQNQGQGTQIMDLKGKNLVLYKSRPEISDISLAAVQDYTYLVREAGVVKRTIILASVITIGVATVIIYLCSLYVYRPLKQLSRKLQTMTVKNKQDHVTNEYSLIEHVVNELQNEKEYALPSVIKDSITGLVTEAFDGERFAYLKLMIHQDLKLMLNILVITECETREDTQKTADEFMGFIREREEIEGWFSAMSMTRGIGLFSTTLSYEEFLLAAGAVKEKLEREGSRLTCCVSRGFKNWENMSMVYAKALRTLERKFFEGKNSLIYEKTPAVDYKNEYYSKETESRLTKYVTEGNREKAVESLHILTRDLSSRATDIQYTRFVYFQICHNLIQNVLDLGGKLPKAFNEKDIFKAVFSAESILDLEDMSEKLLEACVSNFARQEKSYSSNVEKAAAFISANYMRDLSLDDVANAVFLSSGYLSIIFKDETGYTVLEYITYIRMQKAKELILKTPGLKVKDIAEQLGYNNVQSFIRYFKKYYGVTPMAFRKNEELS